MTREEFGKFEIAVKVAREFGFPTLMLCAVGIGLWVVGGALHESVVVPLVTTHTEFMKATRETQAQQAEALDAIAKSKDTAVEILYGIAEGQREIHDDIKALKNQPSIGAPRNVK